MFQAPKIDFERKPLKKTRPTRFQVENFPINSINKMRRSSEFFRIKPTTISGGVLDLEKLASYFSCTVNVENHSSGKKGGSL